MIPNCRRIPWWQLTVCLYVCVCLCDDIDRSFRFSLVCFLRMTSSCCYSISQYMQSSNIKTLNQTRTTHCVNLTFCGIFPTLWRKKNTFFPSFGNCVTSDNHLCTVQLRIISMCLFRNNPNMVHLGNILCFAWIQAYSIVFLVFALYFFFSG